MIEKDDVAALEELKSTQESLCESFANELTALKSKYKALDIDYEAQKSQLIESLLANNKLREALEEKGKAEATAPPANDEPEEAPEAPTTPSQPDVRNPLSSSRSWISKVFGGRNRRSPSGKRAKARSLAIEVDAYVVSRPARGSNLIKREILPEPDSWPMTARSEPCRAPENHSRRLNRRRSLTHIFTGRRSTEERRSDCRSPGKDSDQYTRFWNMACETAAIETATLEAAQGSSLTGRELAAARFQAELASAERKMDEFKKREAEECQKEMKWWRRGRINRRGFEGE